MRMASKSLLLLLLGFQSVSAMSESATAMKQVLDNMFLQYDKALRPYYGEKPTHVGITAYVLSIDSFDETNLDFTMTFYFRQTWDDPRLTFRPQQQSRGRGQSIPNHILLDDVRAKLIWRPDTFFVKEKTSHLHRTTIMNEFVRIQTNGSVLIASRYTVKSACPLDMQFFPFDTQTCSLEIESFGTTMNDTVYYWAKGEDSFGASKDVMIPGMTFVGHNIRALEISLNTGNYSRLVMSLELQRNYGYYILRCYVPMATFVLISLLTLIFTNTILEPLIHVITISVLIWHSNESWIGKLPMVSYINALILYFLICLAHLLLSLFLSLASAYRYIQQIQRGEGVCSICKPLTELDNYHRSSSRRNPSKTRSCSAGSVLCFFLKLGLLGLFVASNVLYWLFYPYATKAANQKLAGYYNTKEE